jgi:translocation protein SEC72
MREELSTTVSNRSAAYFDSHDYVSALADAETVISIRRNWPKGHYRKAKALLGLGRGKDAADAVKLGLSYEPNNTVRFTIALLLVVCLTADQELVSFLNEIEKVAAATA